MFPRVVAKRLAFFRVVGEDVGVHIVDVKDASKDLFLKGTIDAPASWSPELNLISTVFQHIEAAPILTFSSGRSGKCFDGNR